MGARGRVTRSEGVIVHEIDGRPASQFFHSYLGSKTRATPEYPFAVFEGGSEAFYLRAAMAITEEGSLVFVGDVPQGSHVQLTEAGRDQVLAGAKESVGRAVEGFGGERLDGLLVFSCAARKQVLGSRCAEEIGMIQAGLPEETSTAGFYTYGEIAPLRAGAASAFHNETVVSVLFGR